MENGICDEDCNNIACRYDHFDCLAACSLDCDFTKIGNKICDLPCYKFECDWDEGDCAHKEEWCQSDTISNEFCEWECNNSESNFDKPDCELAELNLTKHGAINIISHGHIKSFIEETCSSAHPFCNPSYIGNSKCDPSCFNELCLWDGNDCQNLNYVCDSSCDICFDSTNTGCYSCNPGFNQFYSHCIIECPTFYESISGVCKFKSSKLIYVGLYASRLLVTADTITDNPLPLFEGLYFASHSDNIEVLLTKTDHPLLSSNIWSIFDINSNLNFGSENISTKIIIKPYYCSEHLSPEYPCYNDTEKAEILLLDNNITFTIYNNFEFQNIIINGFNSLDNSCTVDSCTYCSDDGPIFQNVCDPNHNKSVL